VTITNAAGAITIAASGGGGSGDVVGPASSTDNAFARFDSTTGKLLQNSTGATLSDTGAAVFTGALDVLGNSTAGSNIKLYEDTDNGTNFVSLKAPNTIAADVTFTLPSADGTNAQVLQTNGSGVLSFATVSGGASAATPTVEGTVYGKMTASGGTPFLTALGYNAGLATTGIGNTAVGVDSLKTNISGTESVAVGYRALLNATADYNTALGNVAGRSISTGTHNTAIGRFAIGDGTNVATGSNNTAVGGNAIQKLTSGASNTAVGVEALTFTNSGSNNTAVGYQALVFNTTANDNVGVGYQALYATTTSLNNTAVGYQALYSMTTTGVGNNNVGVGKFAGYSNTAGSSVFIGYGAGYHCTAANNIFIGVNAGATNSVNVTTGTNNVVIGNAVSLAAAGNTNSLVLGDNVNGKGSSTGFISSGGGGVYQGNNASTWSTTSDQRLKKNIADNNDGLDKINSIRVRNFEYRLPEEVDAELKPTDAVNRAGVQLGVIAQELQAVLPDCVKTESTGVMSVNSDNLTWYMINAIKELKAEFDAYKASHP
jgi:hypothetical protein